MTDRERLEKLLTESGENRGLFGTLPDGKQVGQGNKPVHFKRCTIPSDERDELAVKGCKEILVYFGESPFYTQALIAGAILSGRYTKVGVITPSQYGKSFLMGMLTIILAYEGHKVNIAAATGDMTDIIMHYCLRAASRSVTEVKNALTTEGLRKVDRLDQSLSKTRLSFPQRGIVQALTLGDTFQGISHNKAIGEGGAFIVDEAAQCSTESLLEIGRREFSSVNDEKEPLVMISNPHKAGYFYDFITQDTYADDECVIWMDALTAAQEGRWTPDKVLSSDFAKHTDTCQRYLLCELPTQGAGMFGDARVRGPRADVPGATTYHATVLGIDAAYRGKDKIEICQVDIEENGLYVAAVESIRKTEWIDGVTSEDIIEQISKAYHRLGAALCCVDIGFGVWLVEGLTRNGVNVRGVNFGAGATKERAKERHYAAVNAQNLRAEMHLDLADLIENGAVAFSPEAYARIEDVLPLVVSERKANGKIQVVQKQEIKAKLGHSPDAFDAVLLAIHAAVLYSDDNVSYITSGAA